MSASKELAQAFWVSLARRFRGEEVDLSHYLAETVEWHLPQSVQQHFGVPSRLDGRAAVLAMIAGIGRTYRPDSCLFEFVTWVAEGEHVALHFRLEAELVNGRGYRNDYQSLMQFRNGRLIVMHETFDTAHLVAVLGCH